MKKNILSRISKKFKSKDLKIFREKLLIWSNTFSTSTFLNSNNYNTDIGKYECICASEIFTSTPFTIKDSTLKLQNYIDKVNDWIFGYINYDLKNEIESLESNNCDNFNLPNLYFFQPKRIWIIYENHIEAHYIDSKQIEIDWIEINKIKIQNKTLDHLVPNLNPSLSKKQYVDKIKTLKNHIYRGDIYEANYCFEWFSENVTIDPLYVYRNLNRISQSPMSVYFKNDNLYLMCSSPERYIKKKNNKLISQPIKGTSRRGVNNVSDLAFKENLKKDPKERSENIMIVDLVRNDMSRFSKAGSVKVKELCEVYQFKQVHQMISTIESELVDDIKINTIIEGTFPMGSMTGAPKVEAMKIIDELEVTKRGLYSGAVGFIDPNKNFDFNVVIRSLIYDSYSKYLSFHVGSAITSKSIAENEYNECLLKGNAMILALT